MNKNPGQLRMEMGTAMVPVKEPAVSVEERNALLKQFYHTITGKPVFKLGQKVMANDLGIKIKVLDAGAVAIVTDIRKELADEVGVMGASMQISYFNDKGNLLRSAVDPRFFKAESEK